MSSISPATDEAQDLRRCVRDLVALSTLPAIWGNADPLHIGRSLAEVLLRLLAVDFIYVRLRGRAGGPPGEAARTRDRTETGDRAHKIGRALAPWLRLDDADTPFSIPSPVDDGTVRLAVFPLGHGNNYGLLAAGCGRSDFPTDTERLLLSVAVNQAAGLLQRKEAEEALRRSEQELADFFENATLGLHWVGPDGIILRVNQAELDLLGYSREEYLGRSIAEFHADQEVLEGVLRKLAAGETLREYEARLRCKDGSIKHVLINSNVLWEDGKFIHTRCFTRDITDRRRAEDALHNLARRRSARLAVTQVLAQAGTLAEAAPRILQAVCESLGWDVGAFWMLDHQAHALRCQELWHTALIQAEEFGDCCRQQTFEPGIGLPGRVWNAGRPVWIPDVTEDSNFPRAAIAVEEGLHGAFGAPILSGPDVLGVFEFFSREIREPDADLLEMMATIGGQIGQFLDRMQADEVLRRLAAIVESSDDAIISKNLDGIIVSWNHGAERLYGYTAEEIVGRPLAMLVPADHPDELPAIMERLKRGERIEHYETVRVRKDGSRVDVSLTISPIKNSQGRIIGASKIARDITKQKHVQQTTRFLADASAALTELTDHESTLQRIASLAVPQFADWCMVDMQQADGSVRRLAVTHTDPAKVRLARELFRRYPPLPDDTDGVAAVLRTGKPQWSAALSDVILAELACDEEHLRILRTLGLKSYLCVPLNSRTKALGALTFMTAESGRAYDADDLRAAEDLASRVVIAIENASLLAALKENDRRKDEFLAMLAHELRNPLAPIRNAVQVIRAKGPPVPELHWARDVIDRQVQQMTRLVDDLLDMSRITKGKIELRKERVLLATVVSSAVEASRPLIEKWGHELTVTVPPEPVYLDADPTRLAQVLLNLLNNAAKYTEERGRIWLTAEREGEQLVIRVKDTGIGIPREMLPRIFEMFTQVDRSLERSQGGLGIGLTLVQSLVRMHGGTVSAFSDGPGKGSEFIVRLPVASEVRDRQADGATGNGEQQPTPPKSRILVVDDNRDAADSLAMLLRMMGNDVHTAHDGLEAVGAASVFQPELVLLDIGLPKLNGYEAGRRIREQQGKTVVLVALTGWGQEEDRRRSKEAGFDLHMTKPVDFKALQRLLAELHQGHS